MKHIVHVIFLNIIVFLSAGCVEQKKAITNAAAAEVIAAAVQRVLPGRKEAGILKNYTLAIKWLSSEPPSELYFKDVNTWYQCVVYKTPRDTMSLSDIRKNDVVQLRTKILPGSPPLDIQQDNVIVFKTIGSKWRLIDVTDIQRKPDIPMP